jgi:glucose dehydrogenase
MSMKIKNLLIASVIATLPAMPSLSSANASVEKATANPANWASWGGNYAGTRYSELKQINTENVKFTTGLDIFYRCIAWT